MVSNRVISFPRQIIVCLSLSLVIFLFALSCQKDEGIKQNDPNALTKSEAKAYFEQTATTLKFLTATSGPAETKNQDYSLTEDMVIEWEQALEGETVDSYVVEIPIRMVFPVSALLYDGIGHLNKNIHQVQMNVSLVIEKHKDDGCFHHYVVTTVGSYSKSIANTKYGFLCDKSSFSGYQIISNEDGIIDNSCYFKDGAKQPRNLLTENQVCKVDSLGKDLKYKGLAFVVSKGVNTKGGGGTSSGEDGICNFCSAYMIHCGVVGNMNMYMCPFCETIQFILIDNSQSEQICEKCQLSLSNCICICPFCNQKPCICDPTLCSVCHTEPCICNNSQSPDPNPNSPEEPEKPEPDTTICSLCGRQSCDGSCQIIAPNANGFYLISVSVDSTTPYGTVSKTPSGNYIGAGVMVTVTANPAPGYTFVRWNNNGIIFSEDNPCSFVANSSLNVTAVFATN